VARRQRDAAHRGDLCPQRLRTDQGPNGNADPASCSRSVVQSPARIVKRALRLRSLYLAERIVAALGPEGARISSVDDVHALGERLGAAALSEKLAFLFRVLDADGDGRIDVLELERMIHIGLAEHGLVLADEQTHALVETLREETDQDGDASISLDELQRMVEQRPALREPLAAQGAAMLAPVRHSGPSARPRGGWMRERGLLAAWLGAFVLVNVILFVDAFVSYRQAGANAWIQVARGCGACLNFTGPLLLVPMLRHLWTAIRRTPLHRVLPLDETVGIHKLVGETVFGLSLVHTLAHVGNLTFARPAGAPIWTLPVITGAILLWILVVMWVFARERVRTGGHFELFHVVHAAYWAWFAVALLHGPVFWKWLLLPGIGYLAERVVRASIRSRPMPIVEARALPSGVTHLRFERPRMFDYDPGDFAFLRIPAVARWEWHPFTLSSAPEQRETLSVHIRAVGNWTEAVRERFAAPGSHVGEPVFVDGPYGTPSAHISDTPHAVTIAGGIGVTPFASLLKSLALRRAGHGRGPPVLQRLHFVWVSRDQHAFEWFTELLARLEADNVDGWLDLHIYFTAGRPELRGGVVDLARALVRDDTGTDMITGLQAHTHFGRPDLAALLRQCASESGLPPPRVFFCGPTPMARDLGRICRDLRLSFRRERF
jgi:NADPH oxidase 5